MADAATLGLKAAFTSNSFGAYRRADLMRVGGFPSGTILAEDMIVAARALQQGRAVAYVAEACAYHSHDYTLAEEFRRYFDIGVLHALEPWLLRDFGRPEGEGLRFVVSEARHLLAHAPWRLLEAWVRTVGKLAGYRLGRRHARLAPAWRVRLSMHRGFWNKDRAGAEPRR